ncbi:DUF3889 domain-containing protein [Bacillus sp. B15-48]|nr:DUF3889 domain-containing protein [Bacillus sp. B15-48]
MRQQPIRGQASWTEGGPITKCNIPWSDNEYMTVAVGTESQYQCGQTLKVRNLSSASPREILVKVVDQVPGYPVNNLILHRRAFQALGASVNQGVINIEILPSPHVAEEEWGKYLLNLAQTAYPGYDVTDYQFVDSTQISPTQIKRTYHFLLRSPQEEIKVQGNVIYNPTTNRIVSFDLNEV